MSTQVFTLEYQVKLTGGSQAASQMNGVNNAVKMNSAVTTQATKAQQQYGAAQAKSGQQTGQAAQKMTGATRNLRALTFGLTGLTSSLVEALGMWGIYSDSAARVEDATKRVEEATRQYGEGSKEARDAIQELSNAERAMNMVRRNTILSFFDMVTWITLTTNAVMKMRAQGLSLSGVFSSLTGVFNKFRTAAIAPAVTDMTRLGTTFSSFRTASVAPMMTSLTTLSGGFRGVATSATPLGTAVPALATSMTGLSTSFKATAGSAIPLAGMIGTVGVTSTAAAGGVGILSRALQFLKANIRGVLIATGIGAVIVALGFLAEHFINAAEATKEASEQITDSTEEIKNQIGSWDDVTAAATGDIHSALADSGKDMDDYTKKTVENIEHQIQTWQKLPQEVALSLAKTRKAELEAQLKIAEEAQTSGIGTQSFLDVITGKKSIIEPARNEQHIQTLKDAIAGLDKNINTLVVDMEQAAKTTENLGLSGTQTGKMLGNIFGANLLEMAKGAEQFKITMTDVQSVLETLPASKLPEFLKLLENSLESMASAAGLEGVAKETFIEFWKDWIEKVEDATGVTEKGTEKIKEVKEEFAALHPEMNSAIESTLGLASGTDELKNKYNELNAEVSQFMDTSGLNVSQLEAMVGIHDELIGSIQAQADSIKNNIIYWDRLTDATFQTALANQEYIFGQIKITEILENSRKNQLLFNQAMIEGRTALRDFVTDTQLAIIRDKEFETGLRALVAAQTDVRLPTQLTIDQLKELQIELQKGGTGATIFAKAFDEILAPLQRFSEISAELAKGGKDSNKNFKKALKDLEIPKGLRKQYDDLLRDLAKLQEAGTKVNDTFQVLSHIELKGSADNFDSFIRTIEKGIQKMADIDPDVQKFANFMDPIFDSLKDMPDAERQQTLLALGNVWEELFGPNGTFMDEDVTKSDVASGIEKITEALNNMSEVDIAGISGPLDQLAVSIEGLQEAQSKFVADKNFKSTVEAYAALSKGGIITFPEPPDVQQTLSDNMGNLVTSTDNLKSSIDALASKIGTSGLSNIAFRSDNMKAGQSVDEFGNVWENGKQIGQYGADINIPGGTMPEGWIPGGAYGGNNQTFGIPPNAVGLGGATTDPVTQTTMLADAMTLLSLAIGAANTAMVALVTTQNLLIQSMLLVNQNILLLNVTMPLMNLNLLLLNTNLLLLLPSLLLLNTNFLLFNATLLLLNPSLLLMNTNFLLFNANLLLLLPSLTILNLSMVLFNTTLTIFNTAVMPLVLANIALWIGVNNILAQTIVQLTTNTNGLNTVTTKLTASIQKLTSAAKTLTSANNTLARTIVQVTSNMKSAASAASSLASAYNKAASAAKKLAAAQSKISGKAKGGVETAASGKFFTVNGERQITVGDNPGGRESIAFIPHNNPGPTLEKIQQMFGNFDTSSRHASSMGAGGSSSSHGVPVIQIFLDGEQVKGHVVKMLASDQSAYV